jgi:hypothetical protein
MGFWKSLEIIPNIVKALSIVSLISGDIFNFNI